MATYDGITWHECLNVWAVGTQQRLALIAVGRKDRARSGNALLHASIDLNLLVLAPAAVFTAGSTLTPMEGASAAVFTAGSTLTPLEGAPAAVFTAGSCSPPRRGFFGLFATLETPDAGSLGASMGFSALRPRLVRPAGIVDVSKGRLHGLVW